MGGWMGSNRRSKNKYEQLLNHINSGVGVGLLRGAGDSLTSKSLLASWLFVSWFLEGVVILSTFGFSKILSKILRNLLDGASGFVGTRLPTK